MAHDPFSDWLLSWFNEHGRRNLPWQFERTFYRVWVSEIMLQQTQVATVIPYYNRFIEQFPNVVALATATLDEVLHHWTGLGYYARARNLHKAANIVVKEYRGHFPEEIDKIIGLPGVGRSTAGAILALAGGHRYPVLDGNVKRVLSRYHAIEGWPGEKAVSALLWSYAEQHTPSVFVTQYTQAIMDLGTMVCTYRQPDCDNCPLSKDCIARKSATPYHFPGSKPKQKLPERETILAIIENSDGEILLEQRPFKGIWGGLWCFPEIPPNESIASVVKKQYGYRIKEQIERKNFKHTFSHFRLLIKPVHIKIEERSSGRKATKLSIWLKTGTDPNLGFPAPVVSLLDDLKFSQHHFHNTKGIS